LPGQPQLPGIEPEIPPTRSKGFVAAWRKGREAAIAGLSLADCPYPDKRGGIHRHVVTWSRSYRKYWYDGFQSVGVFPRKGAGDGH
jgi:hypothetical protein